jgi:hypothetical protein
VRTTTGVNELQGFEVMLRWVCGAKYNSAHNQSGRECLASAQKAVATVLRARRAWLKFIILPALVGAALGIFLFSETTYSLSHVLWHYRFKGELLGHGEVRLGSLVNFAWDKIYFLESYDPLTPEQQKQLFPKINSLEFTWWGDNQNYWTIAYQRPGRAPFLVRLSSKDWDLRRLTHLWTNDQGAKLRLVQPNTVEATYCARPYSHCLALDDSNSTAPTKPYR